MRIPSCDACGFSAAEVEGVTVQGYTKLCEACADELDLNGELISSRPLDNDDMPKEVTTHLSFKGKMAMDINL